MFIYEGEQRCDLRCLQSHHDTYFHSRLLTYASTSAQKLDDIMLHSPSTPKRSPLIALGSPFRERPPVTRPRAEPYRRPAELTPVAVTWSSPPEGDVHAHLCSPPSPRDTTVERRRRRRPPMTMKGRVLDYGENNQAIVPRRRPLAEISLDSLGPQLRTPYVRPLGMPSPCYTPRSPARPLTPPASSAVVSSDATELLTPHVPPLFARAIRERGEHDANDSDRLARGWRDGNPDGLENLAGLTRGSPDRYPCASSSRCSSRYPTASLPSTPPRQIRGFIPGRARISRIRGPGAASAWRGPSQAADLETRECHGE